MSQHAPYSTMDNVKTRLVEVRCAKGRLVATCSMRSAADLFAAAPETAAERDRLNAENAELMAALRRSQTWFENMVEEFQIEPTHP